MINDTEHPVEYEAAKPVGELELSGDEPARENVTPNTAGFKRMAAGLKARKRNKPGASKSMTGDPDRPVITGSLPNLDDVCEPA